MDTIEAAPKTKEDREILPLPLATASVNKALDQTQDIVKQKGFSLKSGDMTFKTVSTTGWGLSVNLFVITIAFSHKHAVTTSITVHYPAGEPNHSTSGITKEFINVHKDKYVPLETHLVTAITEAVNTEEGTLGGLSGQGFDISVDFSIDWKLEGDLKVPTPFITAGGSLSHEKEKTHSVKLVFQKTPTPSK